MILYHLLTEYLAQNHLFVHIQEHMHQIEPRT
jgi:hypothetical protein